MSRQNCNMSPETFNTIEMQATVALVECNRTRAFTRLRRLLMQAAAHLSGAGRHVEEIQQCPMLEPQEEYMLAKSWREQGDSRAAHKLTTSYLRLVVKTAMLYRGYGLPIPELISEGNIGLLHAVKRFDPELGFRLSTYALWWIKAAIQEYILRS